jgi:hypothetical protein
MGRTIGSPELARPAGLASGRRTAGVLLAFGLTHPARRDGRHRRDVNASSVHLLKRFWNNKGGLEGTVASGDHSNRRPPPESLIAISDARIDCFEHF